MIADIARTLRGLAAGIGTNARRLVLALFGLLLLYALSRSRLILLAVIALAACALWILYDRTTDASTTAETSRAQDLDYEGALEALLGMVGRPVAVLVGLVDGEPPVIVELHGLLRSGVRDEERYRAIQADHQDEVLFFSVNGGAGFWMPRGMFKSARRVEDDRATSIDLLIGAARVSVFDREVLPADRDEEHEEAA